MAGFVSVNGLRKKYDDAWAVDDVSFDIPAGKLLVLLGPSGCGKTTTLRCIGGLEQPQAGTITVDGEPVTDADRGLFLQPEDRGMGMVAQSYAIWPHMTVFENVAFPLRMRSVERAAIPERVGRALELVQLSGFSNRNATDLSGGQQQRVALARAIVGSPRVLLFDEPLSNLDAKLREQMRYLLKDIQRELNITGVYVTHDQAEAMGLGDELLVMNEGRIEQRGTARALYGEPRTRFVADFIGVANFLEGELVGPVPAAGARLVDVKVGASGSGIEVRCRKSAELGKQAVSVLVRPEWVEISIQRPTAEKNVLSGVVRTSQYLGDRTEMLVQTPVGDIRANVGGDGQYPDGSKVFLQLDGEKCIALPK